MLWGSFASSALRLKIPVAPTSPPKAVLVACLLVGLACYVAFALAMYRKLFQEIIEGWLFIFCGLQPTTTK